MMHRALVGILLACQAAVMCGTAGAAHHVFRYKHAAVAAPAPGGGTTAPTVPTQGHREVLGIKDEALAVALDAALGAASSWNLCDHIGTACVGAKETLLVYTATQTGEEFGVWAGVDLRSNARCWLDVPGFYFTTVDAAAGPLLDAVGNPTSAGNIQVCNDDATIPLTSTRSHRSFGYTDRNYNGPRNGWSTGYTLTGGAAGQAVEGTLKWYRRD